MQVPTQAEIDEDGWDAWAEGEKRAFDAYEAARVGRALAAVKVTCQTCHGNGEVVTDWDRYLKPRHGDKGDEAVEECPDCDGTGVA